MKEISQQVSINLGCNKQRETQTDLTPIPLIALPPQSSNLIEYLCINICRNQTI